MLQPLFQVVIKMRDYSFQIRATLEISGRLTKKLLDDIECSFSVLSKSGDVHVTEVEILREDYADRLLPVNIVGIIGFAEELKDSDITLEMETLKGVRIEDEFISITEDEPINV